jgi:probable F420-dependent oxidoreductase
MYDPLQTVAAAAAVTETIGIGLQVIAAYYHPVYLANALASLDSMSEGRLKIAIGVGWVPGEFAVLGSDFRTRGKRTDEIIPILRACWDQPGAEFHGEFYDIPPLRILPTPAHRIPIWISGTRERAFARAVLLGDGYHGQPTRRDVPPKGPMTSNTDLRRIIEELRRQRPNEETFTISVYTHEWDPADVDADVIRRERDYYSEIGVQHVVVAPSRRSPDEWLRSVEQLATIVGLN